MPVFCLNVTKFTEFISLMLVIDENVLNSDTWDIGHNSRDGYDHNHDIRQFYEL